MNYIQELLIPTLLIIIIIFLLNPFSMSMTSYIEMVSALLLFVGGSIYGVFLFKESVKDERDIQHRYRAGRNAYLVGAAVLLIGIIVGLFQHSVDPWLLIALLAMICIKAISRVYDIINN